MRIEKMVVQNINSLYGRFEIDFTHEEYSEGLFAIVGPSGSGKSTVLDAMCLALYGRTPRITVSDLHNEAMNKNTDICTAEVVFVSGEKRYRSTFEHRKTRRSAKPFMSPKNELWDFAEDGTQTSLSDNSTEAKQKVVEIVGLKYDQFTRSVMLAQFKFAEFLSANSGARAEILEQVSGTDIYRRISIAVFEKRKHFATALEETRIKKETISVLAPGQLQQIETELKHIDSQIEDYEACSNQLKLCSSLMDEAEAQQLMLVEYERNKIKVSENREAQTKLYETAKANEKSAQKAQRELLKTLKVVRELDLKIETAGKNIVRINGEVTDCENSIVTQKKAILKILKKHLPSADNDKLKGIYEADNEADIIRTEVKAELKRFEDSEESLRKRTQDVLQDKDEKHWSARQELLENALPVLRAKIALGNAKDELKKLREKLTTLKKSEKIITEQAKEIENKFMYAKLDEKFGQQRRELEDGKPCPLCGAIEHPAADNPHDMSYLNKVTAERSEILAQKERVDSDISAINFSAAAQTKIIADSETIVIDSKAILQRLGQETDIAQTQKQIDDIKQLRSSSAELVQKRSTANADVLRLTKQLGEVDKDVVEIKHAKHTIAELQTRKSTLNEALLEATAGKSKLYDERRNLFGDKNADNEEASANAVLEKAAEQTSLRRENLEKAKSEQAQNKADIDRTKKAIEEGKAKLKSAYDNAQKMADTVKAMDSVSDAQDLHEIICRQITGLHDIAQQSKETILSLVENLAVISTKRKERKGEARNTLQVNENKMQTLKQLERDEKKQGKEFKKWNELNSLIGSADGIKFSRIAQGITFDVLLRFANDSLNKMSDRYILVRDSRSGASPLEINVVDNYQAGDIRPVSNLSGGESFVVSMALALGLSEMSSGKTQIDSLFIDEGFASLDENYLELALQTLSTLGNRENKLIGVISHVKELKERIDTQIEVTALTGGRSTLTGPGVSIMKEGTKAI